MTCQHTTRQQGAHAAPPGFPPQERQAEDDSDEEESVTGVILAAVYQRHRLGLAWYDPTTDAVSLTSEAKLSSLPCPHALRCTPCSHKLQQQPGICSCCAGRGGCFCPRPYAHGLT